MWEINEKLEITFFFFPPPPPPPPLSLSLSRGRDFSVIGTGFRKCTGLSRQNIGICNSNHIFSPYFDNFIREVLWCELSVASFFFRFTRCSPQQYPCFFTFHISIGNFDSLISIITAVVYVKSHTFCTKFCVNVRLIYIYIYIKECDFIHEDIFEAISLLFLYHWPSYEILSQKWCLWCLFILVSQCAWSLRGLQMCPYLGSVVHSHGWNKVYKSDETIYYFDFF